MKNYRLTRPPQSLRRSAVRLDNVALVPASLLPFKMHWQRIANDLSQGDVLVVLPYQAKQKRVAQSVASHLRSKGKHVKVMTSSAR